MSVFSGKNGTLFIDSTEVTPVSNWTLSVTSDNRSYAANDTAGWKRRVAGIRDSRGTFECMLDDAGNVPVDEGDAVTLKLQVDASGDNYYTVPAVIDKIDVECNLTDGEVLALIVEFSGNGALTKAGIVAKEV